MIAMIAASTPAPTPTGTRRLSTASRELSSRAIASTCWRRGWLGCAAACPEPLADPPTEAPGLAPESPLAASATVVGIAAAAGGPPPPGRRGGGGGGGGAPEPEETGAGAGGPVTGAASPEATASGAGPVPLPPVDPVSVPVTVA